MEEIGVRLGDGVAAGDDPLDAADNNETEEMEAVATKVFGEASDTASELGMLAGKVAATSVALVGVDLVGVIDGARAKGLSARDDVRAEVGLTVAPVVGEGTVTDFGVDGVEAVSTGGTIPTAAGVDTDVGVVAETVVTTTEADATEVT